MSLLLAWLMVSVQALEFVHHFGRAGQDEGFGRSNSHWDIIIAREGRDLRACESESNRSENASVRGKTGSSCELEIVHTRNTSDAVYDFVWKGTSGQHDSVKKTEEVIALPVNQESCIRALKVAVNH